MNPRKKRTARSALFAILFSVILAAWVSRLFAYVPQGRVYENQDNAFNIYMFTDFREALGTGHWFPQWSTYIHNGLGDAIFGFYEPGFFYLASLLPHRIEPLHAMGIAVFMALVVGSFSMWHLIGSRFGPESGVVAMTLFTLSTYAGTEIYVRGDYEELTAMMLLPLLLDTLLVWRDTHRLGWLVAASITGGALVVTHPIALVVYMCLMLHIAVEDLVLQRRLSSAIQNGLPLFLGGMLAAFYWLPVILEWKLVRAQTVFSGFNLYSKHFVGIKTLLGRFSDSPNVVPVALGPVLIAAAVLAALGVVIRRQHWTGDQLTVVRLLLCVSALSGYLMVRFSTWIWIIFPMLQRFFPWRFLALLTMGLAGIGATWFTGRYRKPIAGILVAAAFLAYPYHLPTNFLAVPLKQPSDLITLDYAQDENNLSVPKGAHLSPPAPFPKIHTSTDACTITNYRIGQSLLSATVATTQGCVIDLPHYYFPGWSGSLNGLEVPLENDDGWIAVQFPAGGRGDLTLKYGGSPARRMGLWISAVTGLLLAFCAGIDLLRR